MDLERSLAILALEDRRRAEIPRGEPFPFAGVGAGGGGVLEVERAHRLSFRAYSAAIPSRRSSSSSAAF